MIRLILFITTLAFSVISNAQVSENRMVSDFTQIHTSTGVNVYYMQSSEKSIKVETDNQEKLNRIKTEVNGGKLKIYIKSVREKDNTFKNLKIYVSAPDVKVFEADSGSKIILENGVTSDSKIDIEVSSGSHISGNLTTKQIEIKASSGSAFKGEIKANSIDVEINSGSNVSILGSADNLELEVSSASNFTGKDFTAKTASIEANTASNVTLTVTEKIKASADSLAKINYYGNPKNATKNSSSLGEVNEK
ncbi:head GIN domain-containing protein [Avrilella dinanensis]|uniref:Putative auto-transporter adhesin head GIN domain-containing protein n=1 Tax=Avrilella dinanensis TaxID=2008672 RepID=A0A2M9R6E0_9FLAO|nr:head GIN domain-containing protein [Avrilella dinanensis]PJR04438.1 hypothetical protein CDL10_07730 [Avrilella dinanensis]